SMADRYAYIPLLGIFAIMSWGVVDISEKWRLPERIPLAVSAGALIALAALLSLQVGYWRNNVTLWGHTVVITERNYTAEDMLASALLGEGRIAEAIPHLRQALVYYPDDAMALLNVATYDQMRGNYASALAGYAKVPHYTTNPGFIEQAYLNSGYAHMSLKEYESARQDFGAALQAQPGNAAAYRGLGLAEQRGGNIAAALRDYQFAADLEHSATNVLLLAQAYEIAGQAEAARAARSQAASLTLNLADESATVHRLLTE
ncbi:MAG: tetratricopeptide repeat protein, partial [Terriglobales bacterium]